MIEWEKLNIKEQNKISDQIRQQIYLYSVADCEYDCWVNKESMFNWWTRNLISKPSFKFYFCSKCNEKYDKRMGKICPECWSIMKPIIDN